MRDEHITYDSVFCLRAGLTSQQIHAFCADSTLVDGRTDSVDDVTADAGTADIADIQNQPCTMLLLRRENALHHSGSLVEAFMVQLAIKGLLGEYRFTVMGGFCG